VVCANFARTTKHGAIHVEGQAFCEMCGELMTICDHKYRDTCLECLDGEE